MTGEIAVVAIVFLVPALFGVVLYVLIRLLDDAMPTPQERWDRSVEKWKRGSW